MNSFSTRIFLFLLYFADGFGFFVTNIFHHEYDTGIIQSIGQMLDPNVLFSVAVLFVVYIFIFKSKTVYQIFLAGIIIGVLPNIKIYAAILVFAALFTVSLFAFIRGREKIHIIILLVASIVGAIIYLPINYGVGKLIFAPGLLYKHFMESTFLFSSYHWALKYQVYVMHGNYIHLTVLFVFALLLFFIPSLGFRLITVFSLPKLLNKNFYTLPHIFWIVTILVAFFIPSFFIQDSSVFVIIQFLWFGYLVLLIPTSIGWGNVISSKNHLLQILFLGLLIATSIPGILHTNKTFMQNPNYIPKDFVYMANFIKEEIPQGKGIFLVNRDIKDNELVHSDLYTIPIISALSQHDIYYEPEVLGFKATEAIISKRETIIDSVEKTTNNCNNIQAVNGDIHTTMKDTNNQYILLFKNSSCINKLPGFKNIHTEGSLSLYKVL